MHVGKLQLINFVNFKQQVNHVLGVAIYQEQKLISYHINCASKWKHTNRLMRFVMVSESGSGSFATSLCLLLPHQQKHLKSHSNTPPVSVIYVYIYTYIHIQ